MTELEKIAKLIRYYILQMTFRAGSGHMTSSLSAVELTTSLFFKYLKSDDHFILSKGHSTPLYYALYKVAGKITEEELYKYRTFESNLEGHPTMRFPYAESPTGSLGQGLSIGVGMSLGIKYQVSGIKYQVKSNHDTLTRLHLPSARVDGGQANQIQNTNIQNIKLRTTNCELSTIYVLLGDGEMAEGQVWEAIQVAAYYKLNNLIAILDVNRLGQTGQTMLGSNPQEYAKRVASFGWRTYVLENGNDLELVNKAYQLAIEQSKTSSLPAMIIAKTIKGKGVSFAEDKNGWHGKILNKEELDKAILELGEVDKTLIVSLRTQSELGVAISNQEIAFLRQAQGKLPRNDNVNQNHELLTTNYELRTNYSTRHAFGNALVKLGKINSNFVVLDADVENSTYTELFAKEFPNRFYQMFIAEQNMLSSAMGMSISGLYPVVSTFAAFLSRAFDQIRMMHLAGTDILINGTHGGVSIGADGPSQMGLSDLAMFRTLLNTTVLYPADAVATEKLTNLAINTKGMVYLRTTRPDTEVIYGNDEEFVVGGSKLHVSSVRYQVSGNKNENNKRNMTHDTLTHDTVIIVAVGITVLEALKAQKELAKENINITVIDCYSIKPIDKRTLIKFAQNSKAIITVEDHYPVGGLGDAVLEALSEVTHPKIIKLGVNKIPRSGSPEELLEYCEIDSQAIIKQIYKLLK